MNETDTARYLSAFGQGQSAARKGGYLADNPHAYESEQWRIWREGFDLERRLGSAKRELDELLMEADDLLRPVE